MALGLDPKLVDRLRSLLEEQLPQIRVVQNSFPESGALNDLSPLDAALPSKDSVPGARIRSYVEEAAASSFVFDQLYTELRKRPFQAGAKTLTLSEVPEYSDTKQVAARLIEDFSSLPWIYAAFIPITWSLQALLKQAMGVRLLELGPTLQLIIPDEGQKEYPEGIETQGLLDIRTTIGLSHEILYLRGLIRGYVPYLGTSTPVEELILDVKAFYGFGIAFRIFEPGLVHSMGLPSVKMLIYHHAEGTWRLQDSHELRPDIAKAAESLGVDSEIRKLGEAFPPKYAAETLGKLQHIYRDPRANEKLVYAASWLYDSYTGDNILLNFVQAMVALEILLGDKATTDVVGLSELMANRCAYLVGKTKSQRDQIISDFRRIYATRSSIVHRGLSRFSSAEYADLSRLRWMCGRVIQEEVDLVVAESK